VGVFLFQVPNGGLHQEFYLKLELAVVCKIP